MRENITINPHGYGAEHSIVIEFAVVPTREEAERFGEAISLELRRITGPQESGGPNLDVITLETAAVLEAWIREHAAEYGIDLVPKEERNADKV